jgi:imidazolonepropionase-like amidohydrolase
MAAGGALFYHAMVVDGRGGPPLTDGAVLVRGDTVAWVGPSAAAPAPTADVVAVDLAGKTLLPGFIDCHVHLIWKGGRGLSLFDGVRLPTSLRVLSVAADLRATIERGVTTARDCMGLDLGFKLAVEQGLLPGPRLVISNTMISSTGGHGDFSLPNGFDPYTYLAAPGCVDPRADGAEACRRKAREVIRSGADFVKIAATGGVASPTDEPDWAGFTVEEMRAVVDEAETRGGKMVAAHCIGREGIRRALEAGVLSIEHGVDLTDELRAEMVRRGAVLVPTAVQINGEFDPAVVLPSVLEKFEVWKKIGQANLPKAVEQGVTIALGTDCGLSTPHGENLRELAYLVAAGMTPLAAIAAGTSTAAKLLQLDHLTGTVEGGKRADLVIVDGDPLRDIGLLADPQRILLVMKDGRTYKEPAEYGLDALRAPARG